MTRVLVILLVVGLIGAAAMFLISFQDDGGADLGDVTGVETDEEDLAVEARRSGVEPRGGRSFPGPDPACRRRHDRRRQLTRSRELLANLSRRRVLLLDEVAVEVLDLGPSGNAGAVFADHLTVLGHQGGDGGSILGIVGGDEGLGCGLEFGPLRILFGSGFGILPVEGQGE